MVLLLESVKDQRLRHIEHYDDQLRKKFNRKFDFDNGGLVVPNKPALDMFHLPYSGKSFPTLVASKDESFYPGRRSYHDVQYLAHSDNKGLHVYNPDTKSIESFEHHNNYDFGKGHFHDLPDDVKTRIPPLKREANRERHADMVKYNTPKDLVGNHLDAIRDYTQGSKSINRLYTDPNSEDYSGAAKDNDRSLHDMMDEHAKPLHRNLSVFSGTGEWNPVKNLESGDTAHTKPWTSASLDLNNAFDFAGDHIIHFKLPKGYNKGAYIAPYSDTGISEREYLIRPDQKWKYTGSRKLGIKHNYGSDVDIHTFEPIEE